MPPFIVKDGFKLPEDGLYSGFDRAAQTYDKSTWNYEGVTASALLLQQPLLRRRFLRKVAYDLHCSIPGASFQLLKKQYARYTPEMVERITGIPKISSSRLRILFTSVRKDGDMKKVCDDHIRVGWGRSHTFGTQDHPHRGDVAVAARQRGAAPEVVSTLSRPLHIQGATDMGGVFDIWPGYLKVPNPTDVDLKAYLDRNTPKGFKTGLSGIRSTMVRTRPSLPFLPEAMFGDAAQ